MKKQDELITGKAKTVYTTDDPDKHGIFLP